MFPENRACPLSGGMSFIGSRCQSGLVCFKIASVVAYQPNCGTRAGFGPGKQVTVTGLVRPCSIRFWLRFCLEQANTRRKRGFFCFCPQTPRPVAMIEVWDRAKICFERHCAQKRTGTPTNGTRGRQIERTRTNPNQKGNEPQEETYLDFT